MMFVRIFCVLLLLLGGVRGEMAEPAKKKLQIFILAGQSNMVGHSYYITIPTLLTAKEPEVRKLANLVFKKDAKISRAVIEDLIATRMKRDELSKGLRKKEIQAAAHEAAQAEIKKLQAQVDDKIQNIKDTFVVSKQVYITSIADGNKGSGPLTVGYGGNRDKIGPEFGFGLSMAQKLDAPILIIKTSWGGKSLNYNFRPPSAGPYELNEKEKAGDKAAEIKKNASLNWRMMNEAVHNVLKDLKKHHPAYDAAVGYDMAGFVWFQGFNDQFSDEFRNNYRDNMIHFVKDVRKEYKTANMPFVIGVLGTNMTKEGVDKNAVSVAQREAAAAPEFKGKVASVESYKVYDLEARKVYDSGWAKHFAEWCVVGSDRPYHYLGSGKFFVRLGDAFANAMIGLIENRKKPATGKIAVKNGEKIAFLGDSITAAGRRPGGYCQLVLAALKDQGIEAKPVFAGISGHKSNQMLARLERDVLKHKPDWMTLSCGVNDVWHGKRGVDLASYKKNIAEIVDKAQAAGVKVILLTSTMIREDQGNDLNQKLLPYNEFIKVLAKEKKCLLADLNADMQAALKAFPADAPKGKQLTSDGVHMNKAGNIMMARGVAEAFGLTNQQLDQSEKNWK
jgi:lysophospholipase L1-like esterase